ncbi:hypothetical protein ALC53_14094 [Atta colombica]|uniref:Uncharacterized protein n=1 Tax=Atta colombica TaxID=520822 RepID=A0A195AT50_9HYME|nr:hypothetical protein ALC53_14094 [Atta colombica]
MTDRVPEWISNDDNTRSRGSRTAKAARNILAPASDPDSPRSPGALRDDDALGARRSARGAAQRGAAQHDGGSRYCGIGTGGGRGAEARAREGWCGEPRGTGVRTPMYEGKGEERDRGREGERERERWESRKRRRRTEGERAGSADGSCRPSLSNSWRPAYRVVVVSLSTASRRAALHRITARRATTTISAAGKTIGGREDNAEVSWRSSGAIFRTSGLILWPGSSPYRIVALQDPVDIIEIYDLMETPITISSASSSLFTYIISYPHYS